MTSITDEHYKNPAAARLFFSSMHLHAHLLCLLHATCTVFDCLWQPSALSLDVCLSFMAAQLSFTVCCSMAQVRQLWLHCMQPNSSSLHMDSAAGVSRHMGCSRDSCWQTSYVTRPATRAGCCTTSLRHPPRQPDLAGVACTLTSAASQVGKRADACAVTVAHYHAV